eukprot:8228922-Karenia_brevis.AAC.1
MKDTCVSTEFRAFIGMDDTYGDHDPFIEWLKSYSHYDAKTAFRYLTGDGEVLKEAPVPPLVQ